MGEIDLTGVKALLAQELADLCETAKDDSVIIEVAVMASNMVKERRGLCDNGNRIEEIPGCG